jgi:hypothetical protein
MKRTIGAVAVILLLSAAVQAENNNNSCIIESITNCTTTATGAPLTISGSGWPYGCVGEPISVTATPTLGLVGLLRITSTNQECVITYTTNALTNTAIVSNWWMASGVPYTGSGNGSNAVFTPTNCGTGTVAFYLTYTEATNCGGATTNVSLTNSYTVVSVASLAPTGNTNCTLVSSNSATLQTWSIPISTNASVTNLEIVATSCPSLPANELPACWSLNGVLTTNTYVGITNPGIYTVVCTADTSAMTNIIWVTAPGGDVEGGCSTNRPDLLGYWSFNNSPPWVGKNGQKPIADYGLQNPASPWGNALQVDTNTLANLSYNYAESNGLENIHCINGAVSFWFKPDWNGGAALGNSGDAPGQLIGLGNSFSSGWSLYVDPQTSFLSFQSESNGDWMAYFSYSITNWSSNDWYQVVLDYSTNETSLYVNGVLAETGPGMTNYPDITTRMAYGFSIGSACNGRSQIRGTIDEVYTFDCSLTAQGVADGFTGYGGYPGTNYESAAPSILTQPVSQTIVVGSNATFSVLAIGAPPLNYQWQFNNANITGATSCSYTVANAQTTNFGVYSVIVTNSAGSITSIGATLTNLPFILTQPSNQVVTLGGSTGFSVTATGTGLTYQWQFNGGNIAGATNSSYAIPSAQMTNVGTYSVAVTNSAGNATNLSMALTIVPSFVAVESGGTNAAYSYDGITWAASPMGMTYSESWSSVAYGNGTFAAVCGYNVQGTPTAYSSDGINWTTTWPPMSGQESWCSVAYGNGMFVAIAADSQDEMYSTDGGRGWSVSTGALTMPVPWFSVAYGNGKFVALAPYDTACSTDGIYWTAGSPLPDAHQWVTLIYGNGMFVAIAGDYDNTAAYSVDGINWTATTLPSYGGWSGLAYGNNMFVAVGGSVAFSPDGVNWGRTSLPSSSYPWSEAFGNGTFVAAAPGQKAIYLKDGLNWTVSPGGMPAEGNWIVAARTVPPVSAPSANQTVFVALGATQGGSGPYPITGQVGNNTELQSTAAYSTDGANWTATIPPPLDNWSSVAYGNYLFVAISDGDNNSVYSMDGINWIVSPCGLPFPDNWNSVAYGDGVFVAIATADTNAAYSTDGIYWSATTLPSWGYWDGVAFGNGTFVAIAMADTNAAYSTDGIHWNSTTLPFSRNWDGVAYGDGAFAAISSGDENAAYSTDGIHWSAATLPSSHNWHGVAYGNATFAAIASSDTNAAYSSNGITWTPSTNGLPIVDSWLGPAYGNGIFVAVSSSDNNAAYSADGVSWTATTMPSSGGWYYCVGGRGGLPGSVSITASSPVASEFSPGAFTITYNGGDFVNTNPITVALAVSGTGSAAPFPYPTNVNICMQTGWDYMIGGFDSIGSCAGGDTLGVLLTPGESKNIGVSDNFTRFCDAPDQVATLTITGICGGDGVTVGQSSASVLVKPYTFCGVFPSDASGLIQTFPINYSDPYECEIVAGSQWIFYMVRSCACGTGEMSPLYFLIRGTARYGVDYVFDESSDVQMDPRVGMPTFEFLINQFYAIAIIDTCNCEPAGEPDKTMILTGYDFSDCPVTCTILNTNVPAPDWGWWKLNEKTGTIAADSNSHANNLFLQNGPTWVTGDSGAGVALSFNGLDQWGQDITNVTGINIQVNTAWSVTAWINTTNISYTGGGSIFSMQASNIFFSGMIFGEDNGGLDLYIEENYLGLFWWLGDNGFPVDDGDWHFVVACYDGSGTTAGLIFYVDGAPHTPDEADDEGNVGTLANTSILIGAADTEGNNLFNGSIEDVRLYGYTLTASEVINLFNAGPE